MRRLALTCCLLINLFSYSCDQVNNPLSLKAASQNFLKSAQESGYNVIVKEIKNTLWIYLPMEKDIVGVNATPQGPSSSEESTPSYLIKYLNSSFNEGQFTISYDIEKTYNYSKELGYTSIYSQKYQEIQNALLSMIKHHYFDLLPVDAPQFIVFVIADINNGIEVENILNLDDYKKAMGMPSAFTQEEYSMRYISELRGHQNIIGDKTGDHLTYYALSFGEFLARQMTNRINFKYQRSLFPPTDDTKEEVLALIKETLQAYQFLDYEGVMLKDLRRDDSFTFDRSQL